MTEDQRPGVALIGCGAWGQHLARNLSRLRVLRTICDGDCAVLERARSQYPDTNLTSSVDVVWHDPAIQAVVIAAPAAQHYALARQALECGKDVLVEKPLALRYQEGEALCEVAESRGRILMVGHVVQFHPAVSELKRLIQAGALGRIHYAYSNRLNIGKIRQEEDILWSFAPHDISLLLSLFGGLPTDVMCQGGAYLKSDIADTTVSVLNFPSGAQAHIFVSWLHPFKEQTLVVVGDRKMAVFDALDDHPLRLYPHQIEWHGGQVPVARRAEAEVVNVPRAEPLTLECEEFVRAVRDRRRPITDGREGLAVLRVLEACRESLSRRAVVSLAPARSAQYQAHPTAVVGEGCEIGDGTKIWHFSHVMGGARIGKQCVIGQNVFVAGEVVIGNNVKIQNNVSVYSGVTLEDDVFCGPSSVFTNVLTPRSQISRKHLYEPTLVRTGASLGANCTILCGRTIGRFAFVGAGAVVTRDVPDYAIVVGNAARIVGWMCRCGTKLVFGDVRRNEARCDRCGVRYVKRGQVVTEEESAAPAPVADTTFHRPENALFGQAARPRTGEPS